VITGKSIKAGDMVLGMASSGVHSNGFSLVRKVLEVAGVSLHDPAPWGGNSSAGAALLEPTVIYVKRVIALHEQVGTWLTAGRGTVVGLLTAGWVRCGGAHV
jgi:phosphoribosylformylglycinamidine cyclo-ligase